uniref:Calcineurin B homologous protein 3 n=1 Tax=Fundulus heteroclitus TaxID=8078 RepID=A0A3Q2PHN4_FUNHE
MKLETCLTGFVSSHVRSNTHVAPRVTPWLFFYPHPFRKEDFNGIPDLASNPIRTQIVEAFFDQRNFSKDGDGKVDEIGFEEFLVVMSHFRPPSLPMTDEQRDSVRKEKLRCTAFKSHIPGVCQRLQSICQHKHFAFFSSAVLFNMHDSDNDGMITLEEYRHVVEELLSRSGALGKETAKGIADAAMLEVASISVGHMEPDEFYEGITFDHFLKLLATFEIESKMSVRFLNMDTITLCK